MTSHKAVFAPEQQHPLDSDLFKAWQQRRSGAPSGAEGGGAAGGSARFCVQPPGSAMYLPAGWAHATLNLEPGLGVGGFLHEDNSLGLHMQLLHAPRTIGSLHGAALFSDGWQRSCARAFRARGAEES